MRFKVLGPYGGDMPGCLLSGFLINDDLLLDAGTIGQVLDLGSQAAIRDVLVSHSHLDHIIGLPFFAVNIFGVDSPPVAIHALPETLDTIANHILNNQVWPDFTKIKKMNGQPVFALRPLAEGQEHRVGAYTVRPVRVNHPVPTAGFVVGDGASSIVYSGDTGVTDAVWAAAAAAPSLKALVVEVSFPNRMKRLAETSGHLTPGDLEAELAKVGRAIDVPVLVYHMKPEYDEEIRGELKALRCAKVEPLKTGDQFDF